MGAEALAAKAATSEAILTSSAVESSLIRDGVESEISKRVIRQKLAKLRHLVIEKGIAPEYLDVLFPLLLKHFQPQTVMVCKVKV